MRKNAQTEVAHLSHETFLDLRRTSQGTISKIEEHSPELGHEREIKKAHYNTIHSDNKLNEILHFKETHIVEVGKQP